MSGLDLGSMHKWHNWSKIDENKDQQISTAVDQNRGFILTLQRQ
jgi:hypothetical protein